MRHVNHVGESPDLKTLRHTRGAWLAAKGVHPKVVQTVMRHRSISLTLDTYGHLFPGQESEAVGRLRELLTAPPVDSCTLLQATGTDDLAAPGSPTATSGSLWRSRLSPC